MSVIVWETIEIHISHEFVVPDPNQETQEPPQLLLAIPSYALSEANQINAALPQLNQDQPQLHHQPITALCPLVMADPCHQLLAEDQQELLMEEGHLTSLEADNSNIFFATNEYIYEYFEQPDNSDDSQAPYPIYYNLIDNFVDEARGEIKAEQVISSSPEIKSENAFYEIPSYSSSTAFSPLLSYSHYYHTSTTTSSSSESPPTETLLKSDPTAAACASSLSSSSSSISSSFFYHSSPSETSSSTSESSRHDDDSSNNKNHSKKYSLFGMTYEEVNERKRQQNKNAARRYRAKKQAEFETNLTEISRLETRNTELRDLEKSLGEQIEFYKNLMIKRISS